MPDTPAERQRRSRAHRRGDHRWCDGSCRDGAHLVAIDDDIGEGSTAVAMRLYAEALEIPLDDPRRPLVEAAVILAEMVDRREAMPAAARELAHVLSDIADLGPAGSKIDELRARRALRVAATLRRNLPPA